MPYQKYAIATITDCTGLTGAIASITSGLIRATKLQASASYTVDKIKATLTVPDPTNVKFSIYSDNSDSPNALLATTGSKTAIAGENDYTLVSSYAVTSGTDYWVSVQTTTDSISTVSGCCRTNANMYATGVSFGSTPDPYPSPADDDTGFQFCISN